jgi:hypothetical protein
VIVMHCVSDWEKSKKCKWYRYGVNPEGPTLKSHPALMGIIAPIIESEPWFHGGGWDDTVRIKRFVARTGVVKPRVQEVVVLVGRG